MLFRAVQQQQPNTAGFTALQTESAACRSLSATQLLC
jgi:hypothetical protein